MDTLTDGDKLVADASRVVLTPGDMLEALDQAADDLLKLTHRVPREKLARQIKAIHMARGALDAALFYLLVEP